METVSSLSEVEQCLAKKAWRGRFPPEIEAAFSRHSRKLREKAINRLILPLLVTYNLFLVADIIIRPETLFWAVSLHAVVSAAMILVWSFYPRLESNILRGFTEALLPTLMFSQVMALYIFNQPHVDGQYQYFAVIVVIFANVNLRPRHVIAKPLTQVLTAIFLVVITLIPSAVETKVAGAATMLAAAYITLMANRYFAWDTRLSFLRALQDQFRLENAEAEAMVDPLTGLKNRRSLDVFKAREGEHLVDRGLHSGAIMIDVDHFKLYNDTYGHQAGDLCLAMVARAILISVRNTSDVVFRYGGEEFLVILPGADASLTATIAERIRRAVFVMKLPHEKNMPHRRVTVSLGACSGGSEKAFFCDMISGADAALYRAKESGRNTVFLCTATKDDDAGEQRH